MNMDLGGALFRMVGGLLSPAGARGRLSILIYHRVLPTLDPLRSGEIDASIFEMQMKLLAAEFNVLRLGEACARLARGALPARAVCVTFDDGYADNEEVALPILKRLGLAATFFVSPGFSSGGAMFNDVVIEAMRQAADGGHDLSGIGLGRYDLTDDASRGAAIDAVIRQLKYHPLAERADLARQVAAGLRSELPKNLMMTPAQIRRLHDDGMEIGAHTINHPILAAIGEDEARAEIVGSKRTLEEITGAPVTVFAYPNGRPGRDFRPEHVRLVKEAGFAAAASTVGGIADSDSDLFQLPRYGLYEKRGPLRLGARMLAGYVRAAAA